MYRCLRSILKDCQQLSTSINGIRKVSPMTNNDNMSQTRKTILLDTTTTNIAQKLEYNHSNNDIPII